MQSFEADGYRFEFMPTIVEDLVNVIFTTITTKIIPINSPENFQIITVEYYQLKNESSG